VSMILSTFLQDLWALILGLLPNLFGGFFGGLFG